MDELKPIEVDENPVVAGTEEENKPKWEIVDGVLKHNVHLPSMRANGLFVAIPMYGGVCYGSLTASLMNLAAMCKQFNINLRTKFLYNESLIPRARNYCVDAFLRSDCNQFIFIDSDIEFNPQDVLVMMDLQARNEDYDIICAAYPKKMIAWEKIREAVNQGLADEDPNVLENYVGDYVFNSGKDGKILLTEPQEVAESGTGFMMIHRRTFEKWKEAYPTSSYKPDHVRSEEFDGSREIHAYFDCIIDPETRRYLSEDYYFCQKARQAGMKVWLCAWIGLRHNGYYSFGGSLPHLARIRGSTATVDPKQIKKRGK